MNFRQGVGISKRILWGSAFLFLVMVASVSKAQAKEAILVVPDAVLGNVVGTQEVLSSLATEVDKQDNFEMSVFAYDVDDDLEVVLGKMADKVNNLKTSTGDSQVSVLGYGIGGLVVRNYLESPQYANDVERVVFVGTPHKGSLVYVSMLWGQNLANQNAWERLYWQGRTDMPILLKRFLPTNPTLAGGVSLDDERLVPLKNAVAESKMADLETKESDVVSPIKSLPITNIRSVGNYDVWYYTPVSVGTNVSSNFSTDTFQDLADGIGVNSQRRIGDGYYTATNTGLGYGSSVDSWASHEELIHHKISDVVVGLGMSNVGVGQYHNGLAWYEYQGGPYPKKYYAVGFEVNTADKLEISKWEMGELEANEFVKVGKLEEGNRVLNFASQYDAQTGFRGNPQVVLRSYADQTSKIQSTIFNWQGGRDIREDSFGVVTNEEVVLEMNLWPYCSGVSCSFNTIDGRNIWKIKSRQPIVVEPTQPDPIILVHGILGSLNTKMLFPRDQYWIVDVSSAILSGFELIPDTISTESWYRVPGLDVTWDSMIATLEANGLQQNKDFFEFNYDWRQPVQYNAAKLSVYIDEVKGRTDSDKVSVVAHSMGGLVTRTYIENMANLDVNYEGNVTIENTAGRISYKGDISNFVMAGTPNLGSIDSIPKWFGGDTLSGNWNLSGLFQNGFMQNYLGLIDRDYLKLEMNDIFPWGIIFQAPYAKTILQREVPSTRDLLPVYENTMLGKKYAPSILNPLNFEEIWFPKVTYNTFLDELNAKSNSDNSNLKSINTLAIAGTGRDTAKHIEFLQDNPILTPFNILTNPFAVWSVGYEENNYWFDRIAQDKDGDETVQRFSVFGINDIQTEPTDLSDKKFNHLKIYNKEEVLNWTLDKLVIENPNIVLKEVSLIPALSRSLSINIFSPANIALVLEDGTIISSEMSEQDLAQKGAYYMSQGEGKNKMLVIGNVAEGAYTIKVTGTDSGRYDLVTSYVDEKENVKVSEVSGTTTLGKEEEYEFGISYSEAGDLEEDSVEVKKVNIAPIAVLNQSTYEGVEGNDIIFDGGSSSDENGDTLSYKWEIDGVVVKDFGEESSFSYKFNTPVVGKVKLTVSDGEFEHSVEADLIVRAKTYEENVGDLRGVFESLQTDTIYMVIKQEFWIGMTDMLINPLIESRDNLKALLVNVLNLDVNVSIKLDDVSDALKSKWKVGVDLISNTNEQILSQVNNIIEKIRQTL